MILPTFSAIQSQIESVGLYEVICSLDALAAEDIAGRLLQCALELSETILVRDSTQLAVQLIGRLTPHRHIMGIEAFLSTIILPPRTRQLLDTTDIGAYYGKVKLDVFRIVVSRPEDNYSAISLQQMGWFTLADGRAIRWNNQAVKFEIDDGERIKLVRFKVLKNGKLRNRHQVYPQTRYRLRSGWELFIFQSGIMLLIDPKTRQAVLMEDHIYSIRGALELTDGRLLSWSGDYTLRLWEPDGTPITTLHGHELGVWGALELPDGRILSWSKDGTIRLWTTDGQPLAVMRDHTRAINWVKRLSDGRFISFSQDKTMRVWSADGEPLLEMIGHHKWVTDAVELSNGWFVSWAGWELFLRFWDAHGKLQASLEISREYLRYDKLNVAGAETVCEHHQYLPQAIGETSRYAVLNVIPLEEGGFLSCRSNIFIFSRHME